jgi:nicotinamide-nucleotide amidase
LSIGTELLLGQVLDTNSQFLAQELAQLGINCFFRSTVGDNKERIKQALEQALKRSDVVITTGGLGPTPDDLTTECIAELFGVDMDMDEAVVERIREFFKARGLEMPPSNAKQGLRPRGAEKLHNPAGTAPGIIWDVPRAQLKKIGVDADNCLILTFPGVPSELKRMWTETAQGLLRARFGAQLFWSCELKHYGIGESALAEKYRHLLDLENPTVAPYAGTGECRLRVTAKARTEAEARALAAPVIAEIRRDSAHLCYGEDDQTLESVVGSILAERQLKISLAESCTGGLVSKRLTDVAGSSKYIELNLVTYADEAKEKMLGVKASTLAQNGAVSAECAQEMAQGVRALMPCDIGVSVTGIAGPDGGTEAKPVGLVYLGLAASDFYFGRKLRIPSALTRSEIRYRTASEALNMVRLYLLDPNILQNSLQAVVKKTN